MSTFCRKKNNNCKFLILENDHSLLENEQKNNIITKWNNKKYFLSNYSLSEIILVAIINFNDDLRIILDEELYNIFELETGFAPNIVYSEFYTLYIFAYPDGRIFDYSDFNLYNGCDISIICNILIALDHEVFELGDLRSCYLTGHNEWYNDCVVCEFKLHFTKDD
jgi:hypothetical protein